MSRIAAYQVHYQKIIHLGIPIMLGQLGIIIVGFADNIMVGHHSSIELAAASFVNNFFNLTFLFGLGFSYGLTPIIGGLFAEKQLQRAGEILKNSLFINGVIGLVLSLIMLLLLCNLDLLHQPEELIPYIVPYYILQLFSVFITMEFNAFKQFSDGITDTLTPMWIMLSANGLNIVGNYVLIYGHFGAPEWGLVGAGVSTLLSRVVSLGVFLCLFLLKPKYVAYREGFSVGQINRANLRKLFRLGLPVGFQMGVESGSFNLSVIMMGWIGSAALAAHQVVGVITTLGFMIYYGIAAAVTIRVSQFQQWNDMQNVRRATFAGFHLILAVAVVVMCSIFLFREQIGYLFTDEEEVVRLVVLLCWSVILYQVGDGLQIIFANALRGLSDVNYMAWMAFLCHFGMALPIAYICGFVLDWGPIGIWCGFPISLTLLGLLLYWRFNKLTKERVD
ncbi:MAG: MATE family efflux transporter [Parabacteroides sp.]